VREEEDDETRRREKERTHLLSGHGLARDRRRLTDVLVVTTTVL